MPQTPTGVDWAFSVFFSLTGTDALAQRTLNGATVRDQGWQSNDLNGIAAKHNP